MTPLGTCILHIYGKFFGVLSVRKPKTSDFFEVKFRCFDSKVRRFTSKKSDVLHFRTLSPRKKFLKKSLHFLHQSLRTPLYIGDFRCRIGCRIQIGCRIYPTSFVFLSCFFVIFDLNPMQFHMILCQKQHETARFQSVFLMTHRESLQMRALYSW